MATPQKRIERKLPSVIDIAYEQYRRNLPSHQIAKDVMSPNVLTTTPEASLDAAAQMMGDKHVGSLIVVKYKTPVGIVTERDLLSKVLAYGLFLKDETVEKVMSYPLAGVSSATKIKDVAKAMIDKKGRLAVFDAGTLVGIITASDLIKSLPEVAETEVKVNDYMTQKVTMADEQTSVINVAKIMGQQRIGSVIITHSGKPYGIFTERDLLTDFLAKGKALFEEVGPHCSQPLITIPPNISVHRTAAVMASEHIRRLPVEENEELVGIVTARDLVEAYAK